MKNIVLTGPKGSGKGTLSSYLKDRYNYKEYSFASSVKDVISSVFMWPRELLEGTTPESRKFRETVDTWWSEQLGFELTPRIAMTNIGTDLFRDHFHKDIWALNVKRKLSSTNTNVVISDLRFVNEHRIIKDDVDLVIKILPRKIPKWFDIAKRASLGEQDAIQEMLHTYPYVHRSEWDWTAINADITIHNNGTKEDLIKTFDNVVMR